MIAGLFEWHELRTRDSARALGFYRELLGWQTSERQTSGGEHYAHCSLAGAEIAGITRMDAPARVPAHWLPYLTVADIDAALERATANGARVIREAADSAESTRSAVLADPQGALFGMRLPRSADGAAPAVASPGSFFWNELLTDDPAAAASFYAKLCGYSVEAIEIGPLGSYRILALGTRRAAGVLKHPQQVHPHWLPYIAVDDTDAATERALSLGASLYFPARVVPGFGRFSGIDDPTGAGVCLLSGMPRAGIN